MDCPERFPYTIPCLFQPLFAKSGTYVGLNAVLCQPQLLSLYQHKLASILFHAVMRGGLDGNETIKPSGFHSLSSCFHHLWESRPIGDESSS